MSEYAHLLDDETFDDFSVLYLNDQGRFVVPGGDLRELKDGKVVSTDNLPSYLKEKVVLPKGVTDVFIWVHGWRNGQPEALSAARKIFKGIIDLHKEKKDLYPNIKDLFVPAFLVIRWPSWSKPQSTGYSKIRDRAASLTDEGEAEFFLASLLGYLDEKRRAQVSHGRGTLRSKDGFYIHCLGHSFGGRFLTAAVRAAGSPSSPKTLSLMRRVAQPERKVLSIDDTKKGFDFTVDNLVVFQMAAPSDSFEDQLDKLTNPDLTALKGPLVVTHSMHDTANCLWHKFTQDLEAGIGCSGAKTPKKKINQIKLEDLPNQYNKADFQTGKIINVSADHIFKVKEFGAGAHGDFFYKESVHLILSLTTFARQY